MPTISFASRLLKPAAVLAALCAAVFLLPGCGIGKTSTKTSSSTPTSTVAGQAGEDGGGDVNFDAEIGDCVKLGGTMMNAEIDHATCGGAESNYKVVAKSETKDGCPSDVDQTYYVTRGGKEQGALCLDTDWVVGDCISMPIGVGEPEHTACTAGGSGVVKVLQILSGTTDEQGCPPDTTKYYTYDERRLVVCVSEV